MKKQRRFKDKIKFKGQGKQIQRRKSQMDSKTKPKTVNGMKKVEDKDNGNVYFKEKDREKELKVRQ